MFKSKSISKSAKYIPTRVLQFAVIKNRVFLARISLLLGADINKIIPVKTSTNQWHGIDDNCLPVEFYMDLNNSFMTSLIEVSYEGLTPLHIAVFHEYCAMIKLLIKNHANVNANVTTGPFKILATPLNIAIHKKSCEIAEFLLEHGADVNSYTRPRINNDIIEKKPELVELLLKKGVNCDVWGRIHKNEHNVNGFNLIANAKAVKPMIPLLVLWYRKTQADLGKMHVDLFKELKHMLTGNSQAESKSLKQL